MGRTCDRYGGKEECIQDLGGGKSEGQGQLSEAGIGRSIKLEEIGLEGVGQEGWATLIWLKMGARKGLLLTQHV